MPTYILLLTLTETGRELMLADPDSLSRAERAIADEDTGCLGIYAVLGDYDFVSILTAPDNETAARFSLELGTRVGAHVATLPAIPVGLLDTRHGDQREEESLGSTEMNGG